MALFCFWFRRDCSQYVAQGLPVPAGSRLDKHLCGCPECRAYLQSLDMLRSDLDSLISVPQPSRRFVEPVWERVRPTTKLFRWERLSLTALAACGVACGWIAWKLLSPRPPHITTPDFVAHSSKMPDEDPNKAPRISHDPAIGSDTKGPLLAEDQVPNHRGGAATVPHQRRNLDHVARRSRNSSLLQPVASAARMTLRDSGVLLEAQGDPGLANVAYQASYEVNPSEDTAFDMGRSAEASGDMEQAMNVYAGLLDSADQRSRSQKGWTP